MEALNINVYRYSQSELEDTFDSVKIPILASLVKEGLIENEVADEWSRTHTLIVRKRSFFRTLTDLWKKEEGDSEEVFTVLCVKLAEGPSKPKEEEKSGG